MTRSHTTWLAAAGATLLLLVPASPARAASRAPDDWITTRVKIALWTTSRVNSTAVHVDTADGRITLHGKVRSEPERQRAEQVARDIPGVTSVRNLLQVVPEADAKAVDVADDKIKDQAARALKDEPSLDDSSIKVQSVDKGAVLLSGKARSQLDSLRAIELVYAVPGVRSVASQINAPEQAARFVKSSANKAKGAAMDDWITTATKLRLIADSDVPALEVSVDTRRGAVTLFGIVPTAAAKASAEADARRVDGVIAVNNELEVVARADKAEADLKDDVIKDNVKAAFDGHAELKHVDVAVKNGVARLTGHVPSMDERLHAAMLARGSKGVRSVSDDLRLR